MKTLTVYSIGALTVVAIMLMFKASPAFIAATIAGAALFVISDRGLAYLLRNRFIPDTCDWRTDLKYLVPCSITLIIQDIIVIDKALAIVTILALAGVFRALSQIDFKKSVAAAQNK